MTTWEQCRWKHSNDTEQVKDGVRPLTERLCWAILYTGKSRCGDHLDYLAMNDDKVLPVEHLALTHPIFEWRQRHLKAGVTRVRWAVRWEQ